MATRRSPRDGGLATTAVVAATLLVGGCGGDGDGGFGGDADLTGVWRFFTTSPGTTDCSGSFALDPQDLAVDDGRLVLIEDANGNLGGWLQGDEAKGGSMQSLTGVTMGDTFSFTVTETDVNGDVTTYSLAGQVDPGGDRGTMNLVSVDRTSPSGPSGTCALEGQAFALERTNAVCGNGFREPGEECDEGDVNDGDGCSSTCAFDVSGSYLLDLTEVADGCQLSPDDPMPIAIAQIGDRATMVQGIAGGPGSACTASNGAVANRRFEATGGQTFPDYDPGCDLVETDTWLLTFDEAGVVTGVRWEIRIASEPPGCCTTCPVTLPCTNQYDFVGTRAGSGPGCPSPTKSVRSAATNGWHTP